MVKNNETDFEGLKQGTAEKARLTQSEVNINSHPDSPHRTYGRFETEQQREQFEAREFNNDDRVVEFDDDDR